MKSAIAGLFAMVLVLSCSFANAAGRDSLAQERIAFKSSQPEKVLNTTVDDVRSVFQRFQPGLDSSTKIMKPLQVSGSRQSPRVEVSIQKCVLVVCETVDLDASISIAQTRGSCDANYLLVADLARSSQRLTEIYSALEVNICLTKSTGGATLTLNASARQASGYDTGIVQQQIYKVLQLQVAPIVRAVKATLVANGAEAR